MTVEEWLGEENQLGTDIWAKKYCNNGESFEQWLNRISGGNREVAEYIRQPAGKKSNVFQLLCDRSAGGQYRKYL